MTNIDMQQIIKDCTVAVKSILGKSWKQFKPYAEHEFKKFTESAEFLAKLKLSGNIDDEELDMRLKMQELSLKNVLLTIAGIGIVAAQDVINALLNIVYGAINAFVGGVLPL
ncbi:MAG: hypothetical protein JNK00_13130 [Flavipsychrobacter sp.]|nr:hypothetical protein [Flavipsychrobacter sp.]